MRDGTRFRIPLLPAAAAGAIAAVLCGFPIVACAAQWAISLNSDA